jgi:hypothetical protein
MVPSVTLIIRHARVTTTDPCDCHDAVCARDFTHDPTNGFDSYRFASWLVDLCASGIEPRGKYVISNGQIASADKGWTWRTYTGSNPHSHHVHVSVAHPQSLFDDPSPWGWASGAGPGPSDEGDLQLSDSQYDTIMRELGQVESKIDSNGAGQNKIWETTDAQADARAAETWSRFDALNARIDGIVAKLDDIESKVD